MAGISSSPRIDASKRVMRTLATRSDKPRLVVSADGDAPMIVALPSDYAGDVFARVRAAGGIANVIVAFAKYFELLRVEPNASTAGELVINRDLSMGMLMLRMKEHPGKTLRLQFAQVDVEAPAADCELAYA